MEEDINLQNFRGILLSSLRKVLEQLHPSLTAHDDALYYVENLCLRLLTNLCTDPIRTIADVEEKVQKTFPTPIDKWALADARETIDKSKKRKSVLPVDRMHSLLQKSVLQYKIDSSVSLFLVAVLEYISADILKLAGNYVKNMKHVEITQEDVQIAIRADSVLMDMFYQGENAHSMIVSPLPPITPRDGLTYEEVVKELLHDEKQYQRDLHMIIKVFREELVKIVDDPRELEPIFSNIIDIYEVTVTLLGSLEDVIEMSQEQQTPCIGSCFEELAEAEEFDVYVKYANDVTSSLAKEALSNLLSKPKAQSLISAGHGFREAVKFYLPKLLLTPIGHAFFYIEYVDKLLQLSPSQEDRESFETVKGLLEPLKFELQKQIPLLPKESLIRANSRFRRQQAIEKTKELQSTVEHWDKDIGQCCNEYIREDTLMKLVSGKRNTERKVFLFDGLLVLCKANTRKQTVSGATNYDFRLKERFFMRKVDIIDRPNTDELKNIFEIAPREPHSVVLIAKNEQHKNEWMADLVMLNTKSMLERILDSILLDIEKRHPLKLPSPDIYKFAVPDSPNNIVLEEKESAGVPLIKGATLVKLIERLTYHIYADPMFVRIFLTTFRSFCSPQELLQLLVERFDIPDPSLVYDTSSGDKDTEDKFLKSSQREDWKRYKKEYVQPVQFRVLNVLRHWADHHYYDFEQDPSLLYNLVQFLESIKSKSMRKWVDSVLKIVQRKTENDDSHRQITFAFGHSPPAIEYHLQVPENEFNLLTLHPLELARQLTLLEFELYKNVKPSELVGSVWTKKDKEMKSPNLLKITRHTTNFTRWIEKSIIEAENFEERVAIFTRAIEVMIVLQELNNFNGVLTVVSAIGSAAVYRLRLTQSEVPKRYEMPLHECRSLDKDHYRKYQEKLRSINPPCVPFFGMYLTNILYIEEGNPDFLRNTELINFSKRRKVAEITGEIQQYQNQPYCLKVDPKIRHFLENLDPFPGQSVEYIQNYLYEQSLRIEPRHCRQPLKFPRKWPELPLKSPGIKPGRRHNNNSNSSSSLSLSNTLPFSTKSQIFNTSESDQQSPPPNQHHSLSSSEFSVFANVNIQGSGTASSYYASQTTLNTTLMGDDTISITSSMAPSSIAPEIPRRSNSIISMTSHSSFNNFDNKPLLSPRMHQQHHHTVSPKMLDSLAEDLRSMDHHHHHHHHQHHHHHSDPMSPKISSYRPSSGAIRQPNITSNECSSSSSPGYNHNMSSPRYNATQELNEPQSELPISPHVNVPNAQHFNHMPPPLPPRIRKKNPVEFSHSQYRQAPDAPILLPRDKSPPPLPPRTHTAVPTINNSSNESWNLRNDSCHGHLTLTPETSTIMLRRNSALANNKEGSAATTPVSPRPAVQSVNSSFESKNSPNFPKKQSTSPKYPLPLPPKPSTAHRNQQSDRTMFPYPN